MTMKLVVFFICFSVLSAFATETYSQKTKLTLDLKNSSIKEVLKEIENSSEFYFLYNNKLIDVEKKVDVNVNNESITNIIDKIFSGQEIGYTVIDRQIIISPLELLPVQQTESVITGKVTNSNGESIPGVTIFVKGTNNGVITNIDGEYSIQNVSSGAIIVFSFVGMKTQEIEVAGRTTIDVVMEEETIGIEEVVAIGYGTVKKSDLTGSVANIKEKDLVALPANSALQAMQGRVAGVTIQSVNGEPGGDYKIRVRGATSINASSNPLFVIDGLVGGSMPPPEDIASIEILKDASASAIYGSRGANGVVMITTKLGNVGKITVKVNSYYSFQEEIGRVEVLNAQEFVDYINDARGYEFYDPDNITVDTDWQDLIFQKGHMQNHQVSVSGGSEKSQYYISGIYNDQKGVIKTSAFNRYSLTTNLKFDLSDYFRLNFSSLLQSTKNDGVISQSGNGVTNSGVIASSQRFDPNQGIIDDDGTYTKSKVGIAAFENPMASIDGRDIESIRDHIQLNLKAEIDVTKGLTFNSTFGTIIQNTRDGSYANKISNLGEQYNGLARMSHRRNFNFLTEQYLNYNLAINERNKFILTGGYSYQLFRNESFSAANASFITDALGFWNLGVGTNLQIPESGYSESKIASFYGRINYNFDDRYLCTLSSRYDGASQFSEGNQWSFFPSGALSWNMHNEEFWPQNEILSSLKIRTSYGLTGNQAISAYQSLARISNSFFVLNNTSVSSVRPTSIANKDLTWETTSQFDIGVDIGFLNRRVNLLADYYYKKTKDLLFSVPIPAFSGFQNRLENLGVIENKGYEIQLESKNLVDDFKWSTSFNISLNRNKVVELPGGVDIIYSSAPSATGGSMETSILREGEPVGSFYGFIYEGVYQEGDTFIPGGGFETTSGGERFANLNDDEVLDNNDRTIIGNPNPKVILGLNNDFSYKGFSLNIFFQSYLGGDMMNLVKLDLDRLSGNSNATKDALNRWTPENTVTDVPKAAAGRVSRVSSRFVEDASFLRLKNISLAYDFSSSLLKKLKINNARVYVSGQNLLTFTNYSGVDPEVAYKSSNVNLGLDYDSYPSTTSYTIGINLEF
ncbi:TonB-dependent receptor [Maribellus comscasis]|nr:TonB-dependent receptor [Maribellus comscasis]